MSGQQIGTVIGGAIGAYFGGPAGAQLGMAIGGMIGGAVDPTHINGPKIGDGQQQTATDGAPIAWVQGTAMVAGTIVQVSKRRQIRHKDNGKGGPVVTTYTAEQDFAILICESSELRGSTMSSVLMVLQDGKLVYDVRPGSTMLADSYKWKANVDFMFGAEDQLPHPTLEAITGVGNTPAYRGSCVAVFKNFDVSQAGDRIPSFQFVMQQQAALRTSYIPVWVNRGTGYFVLGANNEVSGSQVSQEGWFIGNIGGVRVTKACRYGPISYVKPDADFASLAADGYGSSVVMLVRGDAATDDRGHLVERHGTVTADASRTLFGHSSMKFTGDASWLQVPVPSDGEFLGSGWTIEAWVWVDAYSGIGNGYGILGYGPLNTAGDDTGLSIVGPNTRFSMQEASPAPVYNVSSSPTSVPLGRWVFVSACRDPVTGDAYLHIDGAITNVTSGGSAPKLSEITSRIASRGGLGAADYEAIDLADTLVAGYPIARQSNAADCLLPLMQAYFAYASEYDAQLHFKFYGADTTVMIDRADLIEGNDANKGAIVSNLRNQSTEFPRRVVAAYMDPAQNYTVVNVPAERQATDVIAIGDQSFQIPVVMEANDATQAANKALKVAYATLEGTLEYSTPFAGTDVYLSLAAGEPLQMLGKRYVADEMTLGVGGIKFTTRYDRQSAYTSNVQAILGNAPTPPASPYSGPTTLIPMNLQAQRPQDSVGVYIAAAGSYGDPNWRGCNVQVSYDDLATWQNALQITMESTIGTVDSAATASSEPITVNLVKYALENATSAQLAAGTNAFAVQNTAGVTQLMQFATAVETATPLQFQLTSISRSLSGTVAAPLAIGDAFTLTDAAYFLPIDPGLAGRTLYFRGVGFGEVAEDATVYPLVYLALIATEAVQFITEDGTYDFVTESSTLALSAE